MAARDQGAAETLLATYGTLMRGMGRHESLDVAEALSFVARCQFDGVLYDLGAFPGAVPGDGTVHAELFRLRSEEVWSVLDRYEGYTPEAEAQSLFVRRRTPLQSPSDTTAWVYWYAGPTAGRVRVPSGDWRVHVEGGTTDA
ncbi:MAG: gamma-glutamylcyclotransferase [Salinivenus sp.]